MTTETIYTSTEPCTNCGDTDRFNTDEASVCATCGVRRQLPASALISDEYRELVETANLDWQVAEFIRWSRLAHEHSANEVKAAAIREIALRQHGRPFLEAVENY